MSQQQQFRLGSVLPCILCKPTDYPELRRFVCVEGEPGGFNMPRPLCVVSQGPLCRLSCPLIFQWTLSLSLSLSLRRATFHSSTARQSSVHNITRCCCSKDGRPLKMENLHFHRCSPSRIKRIYFAR